MRWEQQQGPFRSIEVVFEPLTRAEIEALTRCYHRVELLSHTPLDVPATMTLRQKQTPNIYVDGTPEEIFKRCRDTVRNEIRRTERLPNFTVTFAAHESEAAFALYTDFEHSQGRKPYPRAYMQRFQSVLATVDGTVLSGIYFYETNHVVRVFAIFSARMQTHTDADKEQYKLIGYASKRLVYELCLYAKERGDRLVDLAAINLVDPERASLARFKSGFGAKIEEEYHYTYQSLLFKLGYALKRAWLKRGIHFSK